MQEPNELIDVFDTFYTEDPRVGDIVMLRHRFEVSTLVGEVVGLVREHPHRGYDPTGDYEVVVYHEYRVKMAGLKGWFGVGEEEEWELVTILEDKEFRKLNPDVVLQSKVDEFINDAQEEDEDDDEL